jgi:hypothetical protein
MKRVQKLNSCPACDAYKAHPEWLDLEAYAVVVPGLPDMLTCSHIRKICNEAAERSPERRH